MKFFFDTFVIYRRQLRLAVRNPAWVIIGLAQPVLYLALFGPLLKPLASRIGATNAYTFFVPGLLIQLGLFGALFAGFGLVSEWREGVVESERVTPANRAALLVGRVLRDLTLLLVQGVILIALGFAFGMTGSLPGMALGLLLILLLGGACSAASYALALSLKSEDALAPILNSIALPVLLLSGILLPISIATGAPQLARDCQRFHADQVPGQRTARAVRGARCEHHHHVGCALGAAVVRARHLLRHAHIPKRQRVAGVIAR